MAEEPGGRIHLLPPRRRPPADGPRRGLWALLQEQFAAAEGSAAGPRRRGAAAGSAAAPARELRHPRHEAGQLVPGRSWAAVGPRPRPPAAAARRGRSSAAAKATSPSRPPAGPAASPPSIARRPSCAAPEPSRASTARATSSGSAARSSTCRSTDAERRRGAALAGAPPCGRSRRRRSPRPSACCGPTAALLLLDLRPHDQTWVKERLGDRWLGFSDEALAALLRRAGLHRRPGRSSAPDGPADRSPSLSRAAAKAARRRAPAAAAATRRRPHVRATTSPPRSRPSSGPGPLVIDGAMGTMVQRHGLTEADFRGDAVRRPPARSRRATTTCSC